MKQHLASIAALCAALTIADARSGEASAEELAATAMNWLDEDYPYLVVDQALPDTLLEFGRNLGVAIETSRNVEKKRVHRYDHNGSSGEFLNYLVAEHGLDWVFADGRLFVSSVDERVTQSWSGDGGALEGARSALAEAGIDHPRFQIGMGSGQSVLSLTAPPRYMAQAAPVIASALAPKSTQTVNVIHGRARGGGT